MADNFDFLAGSGIDRSAYLTPGELPLIEKTLIETAAQFIIEVQKNIRKKAKIATGTLEQSVSVGEIERPGGGYKITMGYAPDSEAAKYFDFVNKGVNGIVRGIPGSPYKFQKDKPIPSPGMVTNIMQWISDNQRPIDLRYNPDLSKSKGGVSGGSLKSAQRLQAKRKKLSQIEVKRSIAFAMAVSIKRKGIARSGFLDDAVAKLFNDKFYENLSNAAAQDVFVKLQFGGFSSVTTKI